MNTLPTPDASLMDPAAHDWWGAGILFALAAACYVSYWIALRVTAARDRRQQRAVAAITFHAVTPTVLPALPVIDDVELLDHDHCDGCGRTICRCQEQQVIGLHDVCDDTAAQGCGHGRSLCMECARGVCDECLTDLGQQGVLSQYVTGTFPTGGAA